MTAPDATVLLAGDHIELVDRLAQGVVRHPHFYWYWRRLLVPLEQAGLLRITPDPDPKIGRKRIRIAWTEAGRATLQEIRHG
ncbi:hypothetical protein [Inquilinus sp. CA228]|uniref:hypothetical protein n=1 Tax=Inquilinus sp. CA228 TaxID=3455609 RepID=UPI003F8D5B48